MNRRDVLKIGACGFLAPFTASTSSEEFERLGFSRIEIRKWPRSALTSELELIELLKPVPVHIYLIRRQGKIEEVPVLMAKELENIPARNADGLYGIYHKLRFIPNSCV